MPWDAIGPWIEDNRTFVTSITSIVTTLLTLGGGLLVGQAITAKWNLRVKEREWDFDAIQRVRDLYGEFLSTRRLWNYHLEHNTLTSLDARGLELFDRCCVAEGQMEALLMKVATERVLTQEQLDELGLFRQGYQQLRESSDMGQQQSSRICCVQTRLPNDDRYHFKLETIARRF